MSVLTSVARRVFSLSDMSHASLALGSSCLALPLLPQLSPSGLALAHLTCLSSGLGTQLYVATVSGPTMFLNLPRQTFGDLQARLFPKMGMVCMSSSLLALSTYSMAHPTDIATYLLGTSLACNTLNTFLVFPVTTKLMYEKRKYEEGSEEEKAAVTRFHVMHGVSNVTNIVALAASLGWVYILASRISGQW